MKEIRLPLYINGHEITGSDIHLDYHMSHGPVRILLPEITPAHIAKLDPGLRDLSGISLGDILGFLERVRAIWADENHPIRKEAFELARMVTGFHDRELEVDFGYIPALLHETLFPLPTLKAELGDVRALDEWILIGASRVRAFPRGRVLHILAGNVPGSEILSLLRGLLTKNSGILKMATGNPVTPVFLMKSFLEIDPEHPVTKATSVLYWPHGSPAEASAYAVADAVCVWGGFDAVRSAREKGRSGTPVLDYGPKRSMIFIDRETVNDAAALAEAAGAAARDIVLHDQLACHSPQVAFVEGDAARFCEALATALDRAGLDHPKGFVSVDHNAAITHVRMMSEFRGDGVYHPGTNEWSIILTDDFGRTIETPLSRTLYVLRVESLEDAAGFADPFTMVIGFSSRRRMDELKDRLALLGVDRLTRLGNMGLIPPGFPHEGRYDCARLVRWVGADNIPDW